MLQVEEILSESDSLLESQSNILKFYSQAKCSSLTPLMETDIADVEHHISHID